jgi:hypothetical protein
MTNRKKKLYKAVFMNLRDRNNINPAQVMMDFEFSARTAAKEVWNKTRLRGCNFHYCQSIRRKAKSIPSLAVLLMKKPSANVCLRMFMRLSLLPVNRVQKGLQV